MELKRDTRKEAKDKKIENMTYEELDEYCNKKKYTQHVQDCYIEIIQTKNDLIDILFDVCNKQNTYLKDVAEIRNIAYDFDISSYEIERIHKKLQKLSKEII
ncbi:hypothetical protein KM800_02870 [Clostridium tyrobutyricum]|uniref:hypothetical protein n=1 Tax=Clostridium tyrobutyricum TaxID=1519 RepID=UPI001C388BBE|nr:hypothetical protein [Clostridium tyrobutyricum]MBV4418276.1 hypothetical protein [Clostridium tyrobutyricum]